MISAQTFVLVVILLGTASRAGQDVAAPDDPKFEQLASLITEKMTESQRPRRGVRAPEKRSADDACVRRGRTSTIRSR